MAAPRWELGDLEERYAQVDVDARVITFNRHHPAVKRLVSADPLLIAQAALIEFSWAAFERLEERQLQILAVADMDRHQALDTWLRQIEESA